MPNRIQRLPSSVEKAPKSEKQDAAQRVVDGILKQRGVEILLADGRKRVLAVYNTSRRCWQLQAGTPDDEALCRAVLVEIGARVKAEQAAERADQPPQTPACRAGATQVGESSDPE